MSHSNLPSPLPLSQFEAALQADPRVLGVIYTGSLGRGTADRFSDLDLELWVTDPAYDDVETTVRELLSPLGAIQWLMLTAAGESMFTTAFLGPNWQPVDLMVHRPAVESPVPDPSQVHLLKDQNQQLHQFLAIATHQAVEVSWEEAREKLEMAIGEWIYLHRKNARGDGWCALGMATESAAALYTLVAALRGVRAHSYRYVAQVLSPQEQGILAQVWPRDCSQQELRRAGRALWNWTRLVWQEAECYLGRSLLIEVDEDSLLTAIDRLYSR
jgi:hypothetical protein